MDELIDEPAIGAGIDCVVAEKSVGVFLGFLLKAVS
jgi:hypothetical protein